MKLGLKVVLLLLGFLTAGYLVSFYKMEPLNTIAVTIENLIYNNYSIPTLNNITFLIKTPINITSIKTPINITSIKTPINYIKINHDTSSENEINYIQKLNRYIDITNSSYSNEDITEILSYIKKQDNTTIKKLQPYGCDLIIKTNHILSNEFKIKYNELYIASILQCQNFFYMVEGDTPDSSFGMLRNNILDAEELTLFQTRLLQIIDNNEKNKYVIDISNFTSIINNSENRILYLQQISFGPTMLSSSINGTNWVNNPGGIYNWVDSYTGDTDQDLADLNRSIQYDETLNDYYYPYVQNMTLQEAYFEVIDRVTESEIWLKNSHCRGRSTYEILVCRSLGIAAFEYEIFYKCDCETCGFKSPLGGEPVYGYCTHYESGFMTSDSDSDLRKQSGEILYSNIYCPHFLGIQPLTKEKLDEEDKPLLSLHIPGPKKVIYIPEVKFQNIYPVTLHSKIILHIRE